MGAEGQVEVWRADRYIRALESTGDVAGAGGTSLAAFAETSNEVWNVLARGK